MSAFRVKLGANDLNCVDVPLSPTHSFAHSRIQNIDHGVQCAVPEAFSSASLLVALLCSVISCQKSPIFSHCVLVCFCYLRLYLKVFMCKWASVVQCRFLLQGDRLSGKPGNGREFDGHRGDVMKLSY